MTHKALVAVLISFCLLLGALITRNGNLALMALPFLTYLGAAIWAAPVLEKVRLTATRSVNATPCDGLTSVDVRVTVCNEGNGLLPLRLFDTSVQGMQVTEGDLEKWVALAGGEETELKYTFLAQRGSFRWRGLQAVISDPFGLFDSALELPAAGELQIQPRTQTFRRIPLRPDSTLHVPGSIPARLAGSGTDFWGVREYHAGDSLRHLDWRLTARHPHEFFTREFEQEEVADIGLILDARQRNDVRVGDESLLEHTLKAAASLAEVFLHDGHRVSLLIYGDPMTMVYPGYGKVQLNRILGSLAKVRPGPNNSRLGLEFLPLRMYASRALVVLLSPLAPGDWSIFPRLRAHGNQGLLICPDPIDFALRSFADDSSSQLGVRAARLERRLELHRIAQFNIRVIDWQVHEPLSPLVTEAFRQGRGRRE